MQHDSICSTLAILFHFTPLWFYKSYRCCIFLIPSVSSFAIWSTLFPPVLILFCFLLFIYSFICSQVRCFISFLAVLFFHHHWYPDCIVLLSFLSSSCRALAPCRYNSQVKRTACLSSLPPPHSPFSHPPPTPPPPPSEAELRASLSA